MGLAHAAFTLTIDVLPLVGGRGFSRTFLDQYSVQYTVVLKYSRTRETPGGLYSGIGRVHVAVVLGTSNSDWSNRHE